jgi:hypothetical protein
MPGIVQRNGNGARHHVRRGGERLLGHAHPLSIDGGKVIELDILDEQDEFRQAAVGSGVAKGTRP